MIGRRETIVMTQVNRLYNLCQTCGYIFRYKKIHKLLKRNAILRNSHNGETCFIMGNGPSLKNMGDLSVLSDKYVITVNTIMRSSVFDMVNSNCHILMDPFIFSGNVSKEDRDSFSKLDGIDILTPIRYNKLAEQIWPNSRVWCSYNSYIPLKNSSYIDFTKPVYDFNNVLHWAILWAIYLGFKKIVLIGADMTGFMELYNNKYNMPMHVYDYTDKEKENKQKMQNNNEWYLKAYGKTLEYFDILQRIAIHKKITIVNATPTSFLDMFPMVNFEDTL